jgi:hypothetical protein
MFHAKLPVCCKHLFVSSHISLNPVFSPKCRYVQISFLTQLVDPDDVFWFLSRITVITHIVHFRLILVSVGKVTGSSFFVVFVQRRSQKIKVL